MADFAEKACTSTKEIIQVIGEGAKNFFSRSTETASGWTLGCLMILSQNQDRLAVLRKESNGRFTSSYIKLGLGSIEDSCEENGIVDKNGKADFDRARKLFAIFHAANTEIIERMNFPGKNRESGTITVCLGMDERAINELKKQKSLNVNGSDLYEFSGAPLVEIEIGSATMCPKRHVTVVRMPYHRMMWNFFAEKSGLPPRPKFADLAHLLVEDIGKAEYCMSLLTGNEVWPWEAQEMGGCCTIMEEGWKTHDYDDLLRLQTAPKPPPVRYKDKLAAK
jgi:hypothetical protein